MPVVPAALAMIRGSHDAQGDDDTSSSSDDEAVATTRLLAAALRASAGTRSNHQRNNSWTPAPMPVGVAAGVPLRGPQVRGPSTGPSTPRSESEEPGSESGAHRQPADAAHIPQQPQQAEEDAAALARRQRTSYHLTNSQAAVELFLRLSRARQTLDFTKRQASQFATLDHGEMGVWEALAALNELREYEAALFGPGSGLDPDLPLLEHAYQCAELCRLAHPDKEWMALVGLVHGLGKLLAHRKFGSQPQWAVCGESFPLGCRFDSHIQGAQFFLANPDRRRRVYNTPTGIYTPHCGLKNVFMSWGAAEYLYLVLVLNNTALPPEALFLLRFSKFVSLTRPGSAYRLLLSPEDELLLPLLHDFQRAIVYRRVAIPEGLALQVPDRHAFYDALIQKYIPGKLLW